MEGNNGSLTPICEELQKRVASHIGKTVQVTMTYDRMRTNAGDEFGQGNSLVSGKEARSYDGILIEVTPTHIVIETCEYEKVSLPFNIEFYHWNVPPISETGRRWMDFIVINHGELIIVHSEADALSDLEVEKK